MPTAQRLALATSAACMYIACTFGAANAQTAASRPSTGKRSGYSSYERETLANALAELSRTQDPAPEGKIIEAVDIVRLEVIEKRDPAPRLLNGLHFTSRDSVIRREVLLAPGDTFAETLADETARNLRRFAQLSLVVCVAVRGSAADKVRVLVITKDTWSLRLSYDLQANGGGVDSFVLRPQETNIAGLQHTASAKFTITPKTYSLGAAYAIPRFGTSFVGGSVSVDTIFNRSSGDAEGFQAALALSQPLYTTRTPWAWNGSLSYGNYIVRRFSNGKQGLFGPPTLTADEKIPYAYRRRGIALKAGMARSWGWADKFDVSFGYSLDTTGYVVPDLSKYGSQLAADYVTTQVPRSDQRSAPYVQIRAYTSNFHRITDFETLGLQEDYRIGYDVYAQVYPVLRALGSARDFLGTFASAQYTVPLGDGMARASVESQIEVQDSGVSDGSLQVNFRSVTPRFGIGRVVFDAIVVSRYRNYLRGLSILGGEGRLRGYPTSVFNGQSVVAANLEYRSRPLKIFSLQLGGVAFFDVGDATADLGKLNLKQSTGFGVRALIPQLNRIVVRVDVGIPLTYPLPANVPGVGFFFGLEQAFPFGSAGPG